jgi:hypothetical protein
VNEEIPMTVCADYARLYESEIRTRTRAATRARRALAWALWTALLLVRPRLALDILRERSR